MIMMQRSEQEFFRDGQDALKNKHLREYPSRSTSRGTKNSLIMSNPRGKLCESDPSVARKEHSRNTAIDIGATFAALFIGHERHVKGGLLAGTQCVPS
jgi:hypothetical protein